MFPAFAFRQVHIGDLDDIVRMRIALLREVGNLTEDSTSQDAKRLDEALRNYFMDALAGGKYIALVAESDGKIVGSAGLVFFERPPYQGNLTGKEAYLMNVYTLPGWRGKGIATQLTTRLLAIARESGANRLSLHAEKSARPIYERSGFTSKNSEMEIFF